jgi:CRISPR-associated endonuclease/helicase Cas3
MTDFYAHSENKVIEKHLLRDHLLCVGKLVRSFSNGLAWSEEAALCGQIHDLGKYADLFQARLRGEVSGLDHWSPGAWVALEHQAVAAALAIQGHHIGLQRGSKEALSAMRLPALVTKHPLNLKLSDVDVNRLKARFTNDGLTTAKPYDPVIDLREGFKYPVAAMLDVRMLFSCLTDADFLDTAAHFEGNEQGKKYRNPGPILNVNEALDVLEHFMAAKIRGASEADKVVQEARNSLWQMVVSSAATKTNLFTITAPTGSGKTLAMLKFALEHAAQNELKRIILAVPYLSIIEQTAAIYKEVFQTFPENYVLEHHSLAGLGVEESKSDAEVSAERERRLLADNWDAPIIITTNVQLLESLFSNRPSACRKLHNLKDSVIMFDEAQTLPQSLAVPTLAALSHLSQAYGTTVLFATATQPAFDALDSAVAKAVNAGWRPFEVAPDHARLYDALRRYEVFWPERGETKVWTILAEEIRNEEHVLCVVMPPNISCS